MWEQCSNAKLTVQNARIENRLQVVGTVLCNIEIAEYMFTFTRMHLAISVSQSCNRWCSLIEGLSIDTCIQISIKTAAPNGVLSNLECSTKVNNSFSRL